MTQDETKILQDFLQEYLRICRCCIIKAAAHPEYIAAHNLAFPEDPKTLQEILDPFRLTSPQRR